MTYRYKDRKEPGGYKHALADVSFRAVPGTATGTSHQPRCRAAARAGMVNDAESGKNEKKR